MTHLNVFNNVECILVEDDQRKDLCVTSMRGQGNIRLATSPGCTYKAEGQDIWRIGGDAK